jgi:hypothetical protein
MALTGANDSASNRICAPMSALRRIADIVISPCSSV